MGDLSHHTLPDLICTRDLVGDLLDDYAALLPNELRLKLDTFRGDVDVAIEDHGGPP